MDAYEKIEDLMAAKYGKSTTTRKAIGDFMLADNHAVNVKSNNVAKQNYSPNMISIKKMHKWVFEERKNLSFIFVDYEVQGKRVEKRGGRVTKFKAKGEGDGFKIKIKDKLKKSKSGLVKKDRKQSKYK